MGYSTDLNDEQWAFIEPIFKRVAGNYGNRAKWSKRSLVNAVLYLEPILMETNVLTRLRKKQYEHELLPSR